MKKGIHAKNYRTVLFKDLSNDAEWLIDSTVDTKDEAKAKDGKSYPVYYVEISSASHPFYTGKEKIMDIAGRVDKFNKRIQASIALSKNTKK